ncbi:hypothetical protein DOTSEDRAFT_145246 [Dothistroma septosporum NZE10]|uniref:Zn(2)-C6 fungal-type domain-containing protein n=1 Tax=Dothistroma septosporum (strain NZE10 / CBS 128990) TaxID=675120 RepID=N1Q3M6_DOTSN|nr:hypothetical protein DOTSEDRAFT_145246 [Dothistroma septosporum NZE10]
MKRTLKSPKSRGGCGRCKLKHIKCDESKPACRMCMANGVECPGYVKQIRWSNKHEVYEQPRKRQATESNSIVPSSVSPVNVPFGPTSIYQTPPEEDVRTIGTSAQVSDMATTSGPNSEMDGVPEWPDIDLLGYEDYGFTVPLVEPSLDLASANALTYPFTYPLEELMPNVAASPDEPAQASQALILPSRTPESEGAPRKSKQESSHDSDSSGLLQTFYRLSQPSKVPGFSDYDLVSYYFNNICTVYSCFDSDLNKFRTLTAELYPKSETVHLAVQFMSLAHLANWYPYLNALGLGKRSEAWISLQRDLQKLSKRSTEVDVDAVMLSLLLLGPTAAWHQASSLGLQYLLVARGLMQRQLQSDEEESPHKAFFLSGMMYWEMLTSFVDPVPLAPLSGLKAPTLTLPTRVKPITPHPWSAVMDDICFLLAEIGRVLRRQRGPQQSGLAVPRTGHERPSPIDDAWTKTLESLLLSYHPPSPTSILNYADPRTPSHDLTKLADAYRYTGLLEIYTAFPALLRETLHTHPIPATLSLLLLPPPHPSPIHAHLTTTALHILDLIKSIPITSAACRLLPLILMSAGSQLRLPSGASTSTDHNEATTTTPTTTTSSAAAGHTEIIDARYSVEARMLVLSRKYAQKPVLQMMDIVKETWERLDAYGSGDGGEGEKEGAHWMDVCLEKSWQTIFG